MTAIDLLDFYDVSDEAAVRALVYGWFDQSSAIEILCDAIDTSGCVGEFEEFLKDSFCTVEDEQEEQTQRERDEEVH